MGEQEVSSDVVNHFKVGRIGLEELVHFVQVETVSLAAYVNQRMKTQKLRKRVGSKVGLRKEWKAT